MYKFEYRYYIKNRINEDGFGIILDSNYKSIEYFKLDHLNNIKSIVYYDIDDIVNYKIKDLIENNTSFETLNSLLYYEYNSFIEQSIYIENDRFNRLVNGNDFINNIVINTLFMEIALIINKSYILTYNEFKKRD